MQIDDLAQIVKGVVAQKASSRIRHEYSIDTRTIRPQTTYIAIKGERYDGHRFIPEAIKNGATTVIVSHSFKNIPPAVNIVKVKNTLQALHDIAKYSRDVHNLPMIGITGSNGKTTTKEILSFLLSGKYNVFKNKLNQNNGIGVPLNLLKIRGKHEIGVMELAMNHRGEISLLSKLVRPETAIITNIGLAHIGYLKTKEEILKAKKEIIDYLEKPYMLFINADDEMLKKTSFPKKLKKCTFSIHAPSTFQAHDIKSKVNRITFSIRGMGQFSFRGISEFQVYNVLAAISCAYEYGVPIRLIKRRLLKFRHPPNRCQLKRIGGVDFIVDCYNANPTSMSLALKSFDNLQGYQTKVAILGDMNELGKQSKSLHRKIGQQFRSTDISHLITLGDSAVHIYNAAIGSNNKNIYYAQNMSDCTRQLRTYQRGKTAVLIKGSRQMQMEELIKCYTSFSIR